MSYDGSFPMPPNPCVPMVIMPRNPPPDYMIVCSTIMIVTPYGMTMRPFLGSVRAIMIAMTGTVSKSDRTHRQRKYNKNSFHFFTSARETKNLIIYSKKIKVYTLNIFDFFPTLSEIMLMCTRSNSAPNLVDTPCMDFGVFRNMIKLFL